MRPFYQITFLLLLSSLVQADPVPTSFKPPPTRPSEGANVIIEEQEVLDTCDVEQICIDGRLWNNGGKTAANVKIKIEIGGIRQGKARYTIMKKVDNPTMNPGDRQDFYLVLERKIPIKDAKGEPKVIEVGKYNFRLVPKWTEPKPKSAAKPKPKKR